MGVKKKSAFPSVFLCAAGTELSDFSVNHPLRVRWGGHNMHPGFGLEGAQARGGKLVLRVVTLGSQGSGGHSRQAC